MSRNIVRLCIDGHNGVALMGRAYVRPNTQPLLFREVGHLLVQLNAIFDQMGFPQKSTNMRAFRSAKLAHCELKEVDAMGEEERNIPRGEKATFMVQVQYRQNATWQGRVAWVEKDETKTFRSALELIKLIDSALDGGSIADA